ncbi:MULTISPECIES: bifunctional DNA primase/polymerase [unclassified Streptomyces]|uniref:bifunctional DNA primase/polymerase n=1 Tax=unclassified Streptomyces TaxID=2593676 RepID=UPI001F415C7C|nr:MULTISPECIES: bifunctional DNA primase/polymerase [unclassified Streptomyces]
MTRRGIEWLSRAADDPAVCRTAWLDDPRQPYLLAAGRHFDVVATDQTAGMETFDQLRRRGMPVGPVMVDRAADRMGFFLPRASRDRFARALGRETDNPPRHTFLDTGSYVVVPGPMSLTGDRFEWLDAPIRPQHGSPLQVVALAVMLTASCQLLARIEQYGQETVDVR